MTRLSFSTYIKKYLGKRDPRSTVTTLKKSKHTTIKPSGYPRLQKVYKAGDIVRYILNGKVYYTKTKLDRRRGRNKRQQWESEGLIESIFGP